MTRPHAGRTSARPSATALNDSCEVRLAATAARAFIEDVLGPGRVGRRGPRSASPGLREALIARPVLAARLVRRRRSRIAELNTRLDGEHACACARVMGDGGVVLRLELSLTLTDGGWEVRDVVER